MPQGGDNKKKLQIIIFAQPVCLRGEVAVQDIALLVLETPGDDDDNVAFADPCPLFDLTLDPAHALHAILAADADVVCSHHQFRNGELLVQAFFGQADTDNRGSVRIEFAWAARGFRFFCRTRNCNISGDILYRLQG